MKDYEGFVQMNESTSELTLLSNLYSFYLQKYSKKIAKTKFKEQVSFLEDQGEVTKKSVTKFFNENDIAVEEVKPKAKKSTPKVSKSTAWCGESPSISVGCGSIPTPTPRYSSGCGGGGGFSRSSGC